MLLWRHCHKKHPIFGIVDVFQTQFPLKASHWGVSWVSQARLYASLRSNSPLGDDAQEIQSTPEAAMGIGVALIFWLKGIGKTKKRPPPPNSRSYAVKHSWGVESLFLWKGPAIRLLIDLSLNHLSCQKDSSLSLLSIHLIPFLNIGSPFLRATYVGEQDLGLGKGCLRLLEYLWERTLTQRESFSWWKRQLSLANKAEFLSLADWRPSPPSFFGFVIFFQPTKWSFFLLSVVPQIKLRHSLSTLRAIFEGRVAQCME